MATGQTLLNLCELLDQELQLQAGEVDVVRGLVALNAAQDYFEALVALRPRAMGGAVGTVATVNATETTAFPTSLLRLDALKALNASTNRPEYQLAKLERTGGTAATAGALFGPLASGSGRPTSYWTDGTNIYWNPLPDTAYNIRWYGFASAADITAVGTFTYKDVAMLPIATFAVKLMKMGVEDSPEALQGMAEQTFRPVLDLMELFNRDGAASFRYSQNHTE
jgi:hypothetical protein